MKYLKSYKLFESTSDLPDVGIIKDLLLSDLEGVKIHNNKEDVKYELRRFDPIHFPSSTGYVLNVYGGYAANHLEEVACYLMEFINKERFKSFGIQVDYVHPTAYEVYILFKKI